jgi:DNA ligase-1
MISDKIYQRDSVGKTRYWQYEVEGPRYRTIAGIEGGAPVTSAWTDCKAKSQATDEEQAAFEAQAEFKKKLDRQYRRTVEELDGVPMSPMLAQDFAKQKAIKFPVFSQPKLDGIRALVTKDGAFTRDYQTHYNVDHILKALAPIFQEFPGVVFDGELYNHDLKDDFNKITSIVRKQNVDEEKRAEAAKLIQYHVYDVAGSYAVEYFSARNLFLFKTIFGERTMPSIVPVVTHKALDQAELDGHYGAYLEQGYEGQMVRLDQPYEVDKRSKTLLKRKEFITAEFPLARIEEGQGNWAGYAKRVVFTLPDGRECGAGIRGTQSRAAELLKEWPNWSDKRQVTIRHFTPTPDGMPRFPVAVDFHPHGRLD